ncbi:hypothetical protein QR98_0054810 [Sarcoptes scabiei]|uniref:Uncharacterized protein n=1 Tax=Sarcoptes scabiei TaxID=52283 RepID=A0A132A802_SARSC|nr:hypothetical protein QR98_0054810 [Sarcoptes scabiei]
MESVEFFRNRFLGMIQFRTIDFLLEKVQNGRRFNLWDIVLAAITSESDFTDPSARSFYFLIVISTQNREV